MKNIEETAVNVGLFLQKMTDSVIPQTIITFIQMSATNEN